MGCAWVDLADGCRFRTSWPTWAIPSGAGVSNGLQSTWHSRSTRRRIQLRFVPSPYDRPYAGVLLGNFSLMSDGDDTRSVLTLSLGVVGPGSGAENLQNGFHDLIGQNHPNGWGSQIQNTPAIELLHERTWRLPIGTVAGHGNRCSAVADDRAGRSARLPADRRDLPLRPGPRFGFRRATVSPGPERRATRSPRPARSRGMYSPARTDRLSPTTSCCRPARSVVARMFRPSGTSPRCRVVLPSWRMACG